MSETPLRVLVIHNVSWAKYKAAVFSELMSIAAPEVDVEIVNVAETETIRARMPSTEELADGAGARVLFRGCIDEVPTGKKIAALIRLVMESPAKVLVVTGYYELAFVIAAIVGRLRGKRIVFAIDSTERDKPRKVLVEGLKRQIMKLADGVLTYGKRSRAYCVSLGVPTERIAIRCQATDIAMIARKFSEARSRLPDRAGNEVRFLFVGRLSQEKNLELLLRVFRRAADSIALRGIRLHLTIVGGGPQFDDLRKLPGIVDYSGIAFIGPVPVEEVPKYFAHADVFVLPSTSEPWGLVVNEAMACGVPCIVSEACGCIDDLVVHRVTGLRFNPNDEAELEECITLLATDGKLRESIGIAGRNLIQAFTPRNAAIQIKHALLDVARK